MSEASTIEGVLELRNAHFWQLDFSSMVGSVDVRVRRDADEQLVLSYVTEKLSSVVSVLTVQVCLTLYFLLISQFFHHLVGKHKILRW